MENDFDYKRIFNENISVTEIEKNQHNTNQENQKQEKRKIKENKYIATFFIQSLICLLIIGSIIFVKYATPKTFVSVSSILNGLYKNNITLSDLNRIIDENILKSDALATFFNITGK